MSSRRSKHNTLSLRSIPSGSRIYDVASRRVVKHSRGKRSEVRSRRGKGSHASYTQAKANYKRQNGINVLSRRAPKTRDGRKPRAPRSSHQRFKATAEHCDGQTKTIDFEQDRLGNMLMPGDFVDGEGYWAPEVTVSVSGQGTVSGGPNDGQTRRLMIFDHESATYAGEDADLINIGSGVGQGMIISEDNMGPAQGDDEDDLDDSSFGGTVRFTFDKDVRIVSVEVIDFDSAGQTITLYDSTATQIGAAIPIPMSASSVVQNIAVGVDNVRDLDIFYPDSGAITEIVYQICHDCPPGSAPDCNGVCGGPSVLDCAGVCYDPNTESPTQVLDCKGECGGTASLDCNGVCNGPHEFDCAGNCYNPITTSPPVAYDCNGVCGGSDVPDCNGVCGGTTVLDCNGVCGGTSVHDCNGVCDGTDVLDCKGDCGGNSIFDCGGNCYDPDSESPTVVRDCYGVCDGDHFFDCGGNCVGPECYTPTPPTANRNTRSRNSRNTGKPFKPIIEKWNAPKKIPTIRKSRSDRAPRNSRASFPKKQVKATRFVMSNE